MNRSYLVLLTALVGVARLDAQGSTPRPMLRSITDAEAEGRAFPRGPAVLDTARLNIFKTATEGTAERHCVDVSRDTVPNTSAKPPQIRFGDFSVSTNVRITQAGLRYKMWWNQLHHVPSFTPMVVRSARIDAAATPADTSRYREDGPVYPMVNLSPEDAASTGKTTKSLPLPYYMTSWSVPTVGTWLVVATAGDDWGCIVIRAQPVRPRG